MNESQNPTELQRLPNVTTSLVLGIFSFFCCFVSSGLLGIILSLIALLILRKDGEMLSQNPELYTNAGGYRAARVIAIIGLVLGVLTLAFVIYTIQKMGGVEAYFEEVQGIMESQGY